MYYPNERHRVFFNGADLEANYKLITASKPIVSPPEAVTEYVEILGADGLLDLTQGVDGVPHFNNRSLTLEFIIQHGVDSAWVMHNLISLYHNRRIAIRLPDDDPEYIYTGRLTVNPLEHDGKYHRITIDANVDSTSAYNMNEGYISVPDYGGDDYMIDVIDWGGDDGWVSVPAPGGDGYVDVPAPGGASDYVSVIGHGGGQKYEAYAIKELSIPVAQPYTTAETFYNQNPGNHSSENIVMSCNWDSPTVFRTASPVTADSQIQSGVKWDVHGFKRIPGREQTKSPVEIWKEDIIDDAESYGWDVPASITNHKTWWREGMATLADADVYVMEIRWPFWVNNSGNNSGDSGYIDVPAPGA